MTIVLASELSLMGSLLAPTTTDDDNANKKERYQTEG
jgi:hypothetical protein